MWRTDPDPSDPGGIGHDPRLDLAQVHAVGFWLCATFDTFDRRDLIRHDVRLSYLKSVTAGETN